MEQDNGRLKFKIEADIEQLKKSIEQAKERFKDLSSSASKSGSAMDEAVSHLPAGLQSAISGFKGLTTAAMKFIATPIGAVIGAIVLALTALKTAFTGSVEGQMAFAQASGYVQGVLGQLKEVVITIGKYLIKAFRDPKAAVTELWSELKNVLLKGLHTIGDTAKEVGLLIGSALTFQVDKVKEHAQNLGSLFQKAFGKAKDAVGSYAQQLAAAGKEQADINVQTRQLEVEISKWQIQKNKLENAKAELQEKMFDTSLDAQERQAALEKYKAIVNQISAKEIDFLNKKISLQKRTMALTSNTIEDENQLRSLEADRENIRAQSQRELNSLVRRANSINKQLENAAKGEGDVEAQQLAMMRATEKAKIDLMDEGIEKRIALIDFEYRSKLDAYAEQETKLKAAQDGQLTQEQNDNLQALRDAANEQRLKSQEDTLKQELQQFETYAQRRLRIEREYQSKLNALYTTDSNGNRVLREGVTEGNITEVQRQRDEALTAVDAEWANREDDFQKWCNRVANISLAKLRELLATTEDMLQDAESNGATDNELAVLRAKVAKLKAEIKDVDVSPEQRSLEEWKDLYDVLGNCSNEFKAIGDSIDNTTGKVIAAAGQIVTSTMSMVNNIVTLCTWSVKAEELAAKGASEALQNVEKASVILALLTTAVKLVEEINNSVQSIYNTSKDNAVRQYKYAVEDLQRAYDRLGNSIDKAFGQTKVALMKEQQENLKQQIEDLRAAETEELSKKGLTETESEEIKREYDKQIDDLVEKNKDLEDSIVEAIFGSSVQDAVSSLGDAIVDAWENGESASQSFKEQVNAMIKNVVKTYVKEMIAGEQYVQRIQEMINAALLDGVMTDAELKEIYSFADSVSEEIRQRYGWIDELLGKMDAERTGKTSGIATASQDSVNELNGRMTAVQSHTFSINENTRIITANTSALLTSVRAIEQNVETMRQRMDSMAGDVAQLRRGNGNVQTQGLKIR